MSKARSGPALRAEAQFVFRTPLLPFDSFLEWSVGLPAAGDPDLARAARERTRGHLRALLELPAVREALFVASPALDDSLAHWLEAPEGARGQKIERALVRYLARMATRATPFGLFSGVSVGRVSDDPGRATDLCLVGRDGYRRSTRLDNDYLFALASVLRDEPAIRRALRWKPNSSLYAIADHLRYAEARLQGKLRTYHLVGVETSDYIEATLARARAGATCDELAGALVADDPEIELDEALGFIDELIDSQILVSDLDPAVTGAEPIVGMQALLSEVAPDAAATSGLARAAARLAVIDRGGVGHERRAYLDIAADLEALPAEVERARLFQVDLVKPAPEAVLGPAVRAEIERGLELFRRIRPAPSGRPLDEFVRAFSRRYEDREAPLTLALDEDLGVGFDVRGDPAASGAPLLAGVRFPSPPDDRASENQPSFTALHRWLLRRLEDLWRRGERELALTDADVEELAVERPARLPDALAVMVTVAAESPQALAQGGFELLWRSAGGPSGARLLGRFCHASPDIHELVRAHLRAEEALRPEAAFAEIVHLNEGRLGNILCRPVLREHEIPYLGLSGAPEAQQIPVQDLMVSVRQGRVVLRSRRLDREVIPRLSTAHNFNLRTVGMYRFLCALQAAEGAYFDWDWGPLAGARFLPRVRCGKLVLARARWRLDEADLKPLARAVGAANKARAKPAAQGEGRGRDAVFDAVQALRARCGLGRYVVLADSDNELLVDLDNPLSVDSFAWLVRRRSQVLLYEFYPGPDQLPARGPEGRYTHELTLTFTRVPEPAETATGADEGRGGSAEPAADAQAGAANGDHAGATPGPPGPSSAAPPDRAATPRRFVPGDEWLYLKVYTGPATADAVLRRLVAPVRAQAFASGAADRWFFLRYSDPEHHLRVRFHGEPARLCGEVLPALNQAAAPLLADGSVWRVQIDTYEREVERYGGPEAIALCEQIFWHDSDAVLDIVELLEGDEGADARWRLALRGADMLLDDLGLDEEARARLMRDARDGFRLEFGADTDLYKQIGERFRRERGELFAMLARSPAHDRESELSPGYELLARRSERLAPAVAELRARRRAGRLDAPIAEFAWSHVHMHVNRLLHVGQRAQELVLYDFLHRWYASRRARRRQSV